MPSSQPLPPKENALFKRILKSYEQKQYKNGLKFAKQILSNPKFAEHGETLSMKGLTLNCMGRKEEAYEHVRRGLRNDLMSHVCWHVYGLLQRSDKKYDEAIKCYRNALKWDKDNVQILRDLSLLQIQMRDLEGYRDTRYSLLRLRPGQRASWIGFAMAYHLLHDYDNALQVLEDFRKTLTKSSYDYEQSELLLYMHQVMFEGGLYQKSLSHLQQFEDQICDKLSLMEARAQLYLKLDRLKEAEEEYRKLLKRNPDNRQYYFGLEEARGLTTEAEKLQLYAELRESFPRAALARRIPLNYASGEIFRILVDQYLRRALHKGAPPLFVDLRSLYTQPGKATVIEELLLGYIASLTKCERFDEQDVKDSPAEPASAILWTYYYLAQHYDFHKDSAKAMHYINLAIEHTPTLIELYVTKGRLYKHAGNPIEAYRCLDEAQSLDTADRYINSKCAKYMLRANLIDEAEMTCSKFTREGVSAMENLNEMQCMWFQTECAVAYQRMGQWGDSLKKCHEIERHFVEIIEDQFDFHTYCMRKMTLRAYVGLLRLEDVLRSHPFYFSAARCAIEVYLHLHDHPLRDEPTKEELQEASLPPVELKKLRAQQRKAAKRAEQEKQEKLLQQQREQREREQREREQRDPHSHHQKRAHNQQDKEADAPPVDDLQPHKLARVEDPLEQAIKFLQPLQEWASNRIETHLLAFEVYLRKGKPLLMVQSVKRALKVDPDHPQLHSCLIRLHRFLTNGDLLSETVSHPAVAAVLNSETQPLFRDHQEAEQLNKEFLEQNSNSLPHLLQGAKMMCFLNPTRDAEAVSLVTRLCDAHQGVTVQTCIDILKALQKGEFGESGRKEISNFKELCHQRMPHAVDFFSGQQVALTTNHNHAVEESLTNHVSNLTVEDGTN